MELFTLLVDDAYMNDCRTITSETKVISGQIEDDSKIVYTTFQMCSYTGLYFYSIEQLIAFFYSLFYNDTMLKYLKTMT